MNLKSLRSVAWLVIFTFTLTSLNPVSFASTPEVSSLPFKTLEIPAEFGQVTDIFKGVPGAPAFIHIQSAHGNYQAEKNIENILGHIEKNSSVKLMLLEGAAEKLQPELFRIFPKYPDFNRKVTDKLMQEGYLTGPEVFMIEGDHENRDWHLAPRDSSKRGTRSSPESRVPNPATAMQAFGVEDLEMYAKDREAFIEVVKNEKAAENYLMKLRADIDKRYGPKLNKELLSIIRQEETLASGTLSFEAWLKTLGEASKKNLQRDLSDAFYQEQYPFLVRYYKLQAIGSKIDREKALAEFSGFIKELEKRKVSKEIIDLFKQNGNYESATHNGQRATENQKSLSVARSTLSATEGYSSLRLAFDRAFGKLPKDFSMKTWPAWTLYAQHTILMQEMESKGLHEEMLKLKDQILTALAKTPAEKEYLAAARKLYLLRRLFQLELTRSEYEELLHKSEARSTKPETISNDKNSKNSAGVVSDLEPSSFGFVSDFEIRNSDFTRICKSAMAFYQTAVIREQKMFSNALQRMGSEKQDRAVIVTGGFHTEGLKRLAQARNCSYLQITPRISEVSKRDHEIYLRSILGSGRDFETSQMSALLGLDQVSMKQVLGAKLNGWIASVRRLILPLIDSEAVSDRAALSAALSQSFLVPVLARSEVRARVEQKMAVIRDTIQQTGGDWVTQGLNDFSSVVTEVAERTDIQEQLAILDVAEAIVTEIPVNLHYDNDEIFPVGESFQWFVLFLKSSGYKGIPDLQTRLAVLEAVKTIPSLSSLEYSKRGEVFGEARRALESRGKQDAVAVARGIVDGHRDGVARSKQFSATNAPAGKRAEVREFEVTVLKAESLSWFIQNELSKYFEVGSTHFSLVLNGPGKIGDRDIIFNREGEHEFIFPGGYRYETSYEDTYPYTLLPGAKVKVLIRSVETALLSQADAINRGGHYQAEVMRDGSHTLLKLIDLKTPGTHFTIQADKGFRVVSWSVDGKEKLRVPPDLDNPAGGIFLMGPWVNRIKDGLVTRNGATYDLNGIQGAGQDKGTNNTIHGILRIAEWKDFVLKEDANGVFVQASFETSGYPDPKLQQALGYSKTTLTWRLNGRNLSSDVQIEAEEGAIADAGLHPFQLYTPGQTTMEVPGITEVFEVSDQKIPTGKRLALPEVKDFKTAKPVDATLDNTFTVTPDADGVVTAIMTDHAENVSTTFRMTGMFSAKPGNLAVLHLWGGNTTNYAGVGAIEPVPVTANGPNRQGEIGGSRVFQKGEIRRGSMTITASVPGARSEARTLAQGIVKEMGLKNLAYVTKGGELIDFTDPSWKTVADGEDVEHKVVGLTGDAKSDAVSVKRAVDEALAAGRIDDAIRLYTLNHPLFDKEEAELGRQISEALLARYKGDFRLVGKTGGTQTEWALATPAGIVTPIYHRPTNIKTLGEPLDSIALKPENSLENIMSRMVEPMVELARLVGVERIKGYYFSAPGFFGPAGDLLEPQQNIANMPAGFVFDQAIPQYLSRATGGQLNISGKTVHDGTGHAMGDTSVYGPFTGDDVIYGFWLGTGLGTRALQKGRVAFTGGPEMNYIQNEAPHSTVWDVSAMRFKVLLDTTRGKVTEFRKPGGVLHGKESLEDRVKAGAMSNAFMAEYQRLIADPSAANYREAVEVQGMLQAIGKSTLDVAAIRALSKQGPELMKRVYREKAFELGQGIGSLLFYLVSHPWQDGSQFDIREIKIPVGGVIAQLGSLGLFDAVKAGVARELQQSGVPSQDIQTVLGHMGISSLDDDMRELLGGLPPRSENRTFTAEQREEDLARYDSDTEYWDALLFDAMSRRDIISDQIRVLKMKPSSLNYGTLEWSRLNGLSGLLKRLNQEIADYEAKIAANRAFAQQVATAPSAGSRSKALDLMRGAGVSRAETRANGIVRGAFAALTALSMNLQNPWVIKGALFAAVLGLVAGCETGESEPSATPEEIEIVNHAGFNDAGLNQVAALMNVAATEIYVERVLGMLGRRVRDNRDDDLWEFSKFYTDGEKRDPSVHTYSQMIHELQFTEDSEWSEPARSETREPIFKPTTIAGFVTSAAAFGYLLRAGALLGLNSLYFGPVFLSVFLAAPAIGAVYQQILFRLRGVAVSESGTEESFLAHQYGALVMVSFFSVLVPVGYFMTKLIAVSAVLTSVSVSLIATLVLFGATAAVHAFLKPVWPGVFSAVSRKLYRLALQIALLDGAIPGFRSVRQLDSMPNDVLAGAFKETDDALVKEGATDANRELLVKRRGALELALKIRGAFWPIKGKLRERLESILSEEKAIFEAMSMDEDGRGAVAIGEALARGYDLDEGTRIAVPKQVILAHAEAQRDLETSLRSETREMNKEEALTILRRDMPRLQLSAKADAKPWDLSAAEAIAKINHAFWLGLVRESVAPAGNTGEAVVLDPRFSGFRSFFNRFAGVDSIQQIIAERAKTSEELKVLLVAAASAQAEVSNVPAAKIKAAIAGLTDLDEMREKILALGKPAAPVRSETRNVMTPEVFTGHLKAVQALLLRFPMDERDRQDGVVVRVGGVKVPLSDVLPDNVHAFWPNDPAGLAEKLNAIVGRIQGSLDIHKEFTPETPRMSETVKLMADLRAISATLQGATLAAAGRSEARVGFPDLRNFYEHLATAAGREALERIETIEIVNAQDVPVILDAGMKTLFIESPQGLIDPQGRHHDIGHIRNVGGLRFNPATRIFLGTYTPQGATASVVLFNLQYAGDQDLWVVREARSEVRAIKAALAMLALGGVAALAEVEMRWIAVDEYSATAQLANTGSVPVWVSAKALWTTSLVGKAAVVTNTVWDAELPVPDIENPPPAAPVIRPASLSAAKTVFVKGVLTESPVRNAVTDPQYTNQWAYGAAPNQAAPAGAFVNGELVIQYPQITNGTTWAELALIPNVNGADTRAVLVTFKGTAGSRILFNFISQDGSNHVKLATCTGEWQTLRWDDLPTHRRFTSFLAIRNPDGSSADPVPDGDQASELTIQKIISVPRSEARAIALPQVIGIPQEAYLVDDETISLSDLMERLGVSIRGMARTAREVTDGVYARSVISAAKAKAQLLTWAMPERSGEFSTAYEATVKRTARMLLGIGQKTTLTASDVLVLSSVLVSQDLEVAAAMRSAYFGATILAAVRNAAERTFIEELNLRLAKAGFSEVIPVDEQDPAGLKAQLERVRKAHGAVQVTAMVYGELVPELLKEYNLVNVTPRMLKGFLNAMGTLVEKLVSDLAATFALAKSA